MVEHDPTVRRRDYRQALQRTAAAVEQLDGQVEAAELGPVASEAALVELECALGLRLPHAFRRLLRYVGASLQVRWRLPWALAAPGSLRAITTGNWCFNAAALPDLQRHHRMLLDSAFADRSDPHAALWHGKLPLQALDNGDLIALDLQTGFAPLVYLCRVPGPAHGCTIGPTVTDAFDSLAALGFPGAEHWQWEMFVPDPAHGIDVTHKHATQWQRWFFDP